jgi:LmbE family N-acetylglucosaminyl deacetylase
VGTVRRLGCVLAHPDDETFCAGGTIAKLAAAGEQIDLFCATDGDAGKSSGIPISSRNELAARRRAELTMASRILGIGSLSTPGHGDGVLKEVDPERLIGEIVFFLRRYRSDVVLTFGPEGAPTQHRDHRAISRAATAAYFLAGLPTEYADQLREVEPHSPARLYYAAWDPPAESAELRTLSAPVTCRVAVSDYLDVKRKAFLAHETQRQHEARFEELKMLPTERFALAAGVPQPRAVTEGLFEGL